MTVLSFIALQAFKTDRMSEMCLSSVADLKSEDEALLYLDCLNNLAVKIQNEDEDIILISLKKKHQMTCNNPKCFCGSVETTRDFIRHYIDQ